jgi:hypothetical protein
MISVVDTDAVSDASNGYFRRKDRVRSPFLALS